jgi:two-component system cell cycle response regulator
MDLDLVGQIQNQRSLPTIPPVALEVVRLCGRDDVPLEDIARAAMQDPALTSRLLRIANAPPFGKPRQISSVSQAVSLLGLRTVRVVALASALIDNVEHRKIPGFDYEAFWRDSVAAALAARSFSEIGPSAHPDEAFLAGLLQDLGVYGLADALQKPYLDLLQEAYEKGAEIAPLEEQRLNVNHAEVSAALLESWGFPERIVEAVRRHARPATGFPPPTDIDEIATAAHLGELAATTFRRPTPGVLDLLARRAQELFGLTAEAVSEVLLFVHRNAEETSRALNLNVGSTDELKVIRRQIEELLRGGGGRAEKLPPAAEAADNFAEMAARVDPVTGVLTRGVIEREVLRCLEDGEALGRGLAVIVFDLHPAGAPGDSGGSDNFVRAVSHVLKVSLPPTACIGRGTGASFVLVLPDVAPDTANDLAERAVRNVAAMVRDPRGKEAHSVNAGIRWTAPGETCTAVEILREAGHALGWAREAGPNRIVTARPMRALQAEEEEALPPPAD